MPTENMTEASSEASKVPAPTETCCHEPAQARRPGGAFSTRNAEEVPNSPPGREALHAAREGEQQGVAGDADLGVGGQHGDQRWRRPSGGS